VGNDLYVTGNSTLQGTVQVTGAATLSNTLHVSGAANFAAQANFSAGAVGLHFTSYSDRRLKTDFEEVEDALAKVQALHPVFYNWSNGSPNINPSVKDLGMIAQEVEAILPHIVRTEEGEDGMKRISYDRIAVLLVAAVKEQSAIIDDLKARVNRLEA
jgi:hypothetical protein